MKKNRKIFYGWWILIACFFLSGGGVGILINSMGTFIKPVSEALNYSRAKLSLATSLSSFAGMLLYPVWGSYMKNLHRISDTARLSGIFILQADVAVLPVRDTDRLHDGKYLHAADNNNNQ